MNDRTAPILSAFALSMLALFIGFKVVTGLTWYHHQKQMEQAQERANLPTGPIEQVKAIEARGALEALKDLNRSDGQFPCAASQRAQYPSMRETDAGSRTDELEDAWWTWRSAHVTCVTDNLN